MSEIDEILTPSNDSWERFTTEKGENGLRLKNQPPRETRSERLEFRVLPSIKTKLSEVAKKQGCTSADLIEHALNYYFKDLADIDIDVSALDNTIVDYIIKWQNLENPSDKEADFLVFLNDLHESMTQRFNIQPDLSGLTEWEKRELGFENEQ